MVIYAIIGYIAEFNERKLAASLPAHTQPLVPLPLIAHHIAGSLYALLHWWLRQDMSYSPACMAR